METVLFVIIWFGGAAVHTMIELRLRKWPASDLVVEPAWEERRSNRK